MTTRRITFEGPCNFRDLGGYETVDGRVVRWGRVYRSDSLHTATAADVPTLRELGVRTAVDFRTGDELTRLGAGPLAELAVRHVHCSTVDAAVREGESSRPAFVGDRAADFYMLMLEHGAPAYASALQALAEADSLPAVFFCLAGKDRTGCFAALLLGLLGVPDDTIVADYELTQEILPVLTARRLERDGPATEEERWRHIPADLREAPARTMEELVQRVHDRWNGWAGYAEFARVGRDVVAHLHTQLLERPEPR